MVSTTETQARARFGGSQASIEKVIQRFAFRRARPFKLLSTLRPEGYGPEMTAWIRTFEDWEMEAADPSDGELKAPGEKQSLTALVESKGPSWIADFMAYFLDASVVLQQDEMSYIASLAGTAHGSSKVYYFHPNDWGLWPTDASVTTRMYRMLQEEERLELAHTRFKGADKRKFDASLQVFETLEKDAALPALRDPARLWPRVDWLVHAMLGVGADLRLQLDRAPGFETYEQEAPHLATHPHLAAYWAWAHYFFDNRQALQDVLQRTAKCEDPVLMECRELIQNIRSGRRVRVGEHDQTGFAALKEEIMQRAPLSVFEPAAKIRVNALKADLAAESAVNQDAISVLEDAARREPLVREALVLLEHLAVGGAMAPGPAPVHGGLPVDNAMDRLAELMDERFLDLIRARLEHSLHVTDGHEKAAWGLLGAWAAVAPDFDAFEALLKDVGTENLGPRRMKELYRAYGRFDDTRATSFLFGAARQWLGEMNDWIRKVPDEAILQLLLRDTLDTHRVIAALLEKANYNGANLEVCVAAAVAADELKSKRAITGLRRAVEQRLGRVDDGSRAKVVQALVSVEGKASLPFLHSLFEWSMDEWENAEEEDRDTHQKDLACYLRGLLTLAPDDTVVVATARKLLELLQLKLGKNRTPRRDMIAAASAILDGIRAGEVRGLADSVLPYRGLAFRETASTHTAAVELRALATSLVDELES